MEDGLKTDDEKALETLIQWAESAEDATAESRELSERDRDYYDNKQWTAEEEKTLRNRKQPVIVSNRIAPKINYLLGSEIKYRTDPRAYPRNPQDQDGENAATDALRYVSQDARWNSKRSECSLNYLVEGYCGIDITTEERKEGDYCINLEYVPWDRIWFDPHSRRKLFEDAKYIGMDVWMDAEEAKLKWPSKDKVIDDSLSSASQNDQDTYGDIPRNRWADDKRRRVRISSCWSKENGTVMYSVFTKGGILERMESPYLDEDGKPESGLVLASCFVDRDGNRYGVARQFISLQDEINKRRSKALHLLNVRQTIGEKGAVEDVRKAKAELSKPDGHIEITPQMKFDILPTGDMAAAQLNLLQEAKNEIDNVGVNAAMAGTEDRNMSGRALMARQESGMAELGPVFDGFKQMQYLVYRKIWNRIKQFWTTEKWIRITDDDKTARFVGLNVPITMGEQLREEMQARGEEITPQVEAYIRINPDMQRIVGIRNNTAQMDVDIVIEDAPASASLQGEEFQALVQIAPMMAQAGKPIPPEVLIEASSLRSKDKILKMMRGEDQQGMPPQAQAKLQDQMQVIQGLQQAMQQAMQQQEQMARELEALKADKAIEARKVEVDAFSAETDRTKVILDAQVAAMQAQNQPVPEPAEPVAEQEPRQEMPPIQITVPVTVVRDNTPTVKQGRMVRLPDGSYSMESMEVPQ